MDAVSPPTPGAAAHVADGKVAPGATDAARDGAIGAKVVRGGSGAMFDAIAARYDLLNGLTSFGLDARWRRRLVDALNLEAALANFSAPRGASRGESSPAAEPVRVLDVATGTADVALTILRRHPHVHVVGLDPSGQMLARGADKARARGYAGRLTLLEGDAQRLPFVDHHFAASCISFGIRNVPDRSAALREMARVTKPGGRVCVLELGEPRGFLVGALGRAYVHGVVPLLGALLSGRSAYRYLERSIAAFPPPEMFAQRMAEAGLRQVRVTPLMFGAANLYSGVTEHN